MKLKQAKVNFKPIIIKLETLKEATEFWELIDNSDPITDVGRKLRMRISNWFSDNAAIIGVKDK